MTHRGARLKRPPSSPRLPSVINAAPPAGTIPAGGAPASMKVFKSYLTYVVKHDPLKRMPGMVF